MTKDIIVKHKTQEKVGNKWIDTEILPEVKISRDMFEKSFVDERWQNERRLNKEYTKYGYYHTKTIVNFDQNYRSVRDFIFPN